MAESEEELKSLLMRMKEQSEKASLKLNFHKIKIMASNPISPWQIVGGKKWKHWQIFFFFHAPKLLQVVTAATKLKDTWSLKEKLWRTLVQFGSNAQSCLTVCDPMDCSLPGFPVHHQIPGFAQAHVHWVGDASFSISPSNEYSELISFRIDWFDLLVVQGTLKSVLQHHHFFGTRLLYGSTLTSIHN